MHKHSNRLQGRDHDFHSPTDESLRATRGIIYIHLCSVNPLLTTMTVDLLSRNIESVIHITLANNAGINVVPESCYRVGIHHISILNFVHGEYRPLSGS